MYQFVADFPVHYSLEQPARTRLVGFPGEDMDLEGDQLIECLARPVGGFARSVGVRDGKRDALAPLTLCGLVHTIVYTSVFMRLISFEPFTSTIAIYHNEIDASLCVYHSIDSSTKTFQSNAFQLNEGVGASIVFLSIPIHSSQQHTSSAVLSWIFLSCPQ